jgi:predicted transcriptional regulator
MSNPDPTYVVDPSFWDELDEAAEAAADAEAFADIEAGRVIPHEEVAAWLDTWGTPDEKPAPAHWFK